ncbi:MAG: hypothetical protein HXX08_23955 [Chloroflexi bacterium]|uniref:Uncharacterized protein n=1 Tax=Candidatus Chlorohelix allophototropha TaxID=3003348 RepID=A0A8T7M9V7_9CHLR|nr:hypothetical protein [Chloroflexota bacterium]WJW68858.1 hypothetical protein OZ401_004477 [Chloroflexota bacterium L227-S17]
MKNKITEGRFTPSTGRRRTAHLSPGWGIQIGSHESWFVGAHRDAPAFAGKI